MGIRVNLVGKMSTSFELWVMKKCKKCNWALATSCNIHFKAVDKFPLEKCVSQGDGVRNIQPWKCVESIML